MYLQQPQGSCVCTSNIREKHYGQDQRTEGRDGGRSRDGWHQPKQQAQVIQTSLEGVGLSGTGLRRSDGQVPYGMGQNDNGSDGEIGMETASRK